MKLFGPFLDKMTAYAKATGASIVSLTSRPFCTFDAEQIDWRYFRDTLFDRKSSNAEFVSYYTATDFSKKKPLVMMQKDIDATHSLHRSFVVRHKTRIQMYRDDAAVKSVRLPSSIAISQASVDSINTRLKGPQ